MDYASSSASRQQQEQEQARIESKFRVLWEKQTYVNLLYLLVSFPLGIISFVVIINMFVLTLGFTVFSLLIGLLVLPFLYLLRALSRRRGEWREARTSGEGVAVDRVRLFLLLSITGFGFVLIAFYVLNALAYVSGQFARVMLGLRASPSRS
jgi:hypothetical protein